MVLIKPHSVVVTPQTQPQGSNQVIQNPTAGDPSDAIACLVSPMAPSEAYQTFGVALLDPRKVLIEVADAASFSPNATIVFNGANFWQKGYTEIHQNGDDADCAIVYMSRNQFPQIS